MGAWTFVEPRLRELLPPGLPLSYIGRPERAATAEGQADVHTHEQAKIVEAAYAGEPVDTRALNETREEQHVG